MNEMSQCRPSVFKSKADLPPGGEACGNLARVGGEGEGGGGGEGRGWRGGREGRGGEGRAWDGGGNNFNLPHARELPCIMNLD